MANAINSAMNDGTPPLVGNAIYSASNDGYVQFSSTSSGNGSTIAISDPATANTYLFELDASPDTIIGATFISDPSISQGSPPGSPFITPDSIEILGDVTANFPVGKVFTIRGSNDLTYGSYDGTYSVHVNGATVGGSPLTTTIPIATPDDSAINTPLLPLYNPNGSPPPAPPGSPAPYGFVYITPIAGIDSYGTPVNGLEGDYMETDAAGAAVNIGENTSYVVFNYDILSGSRIETLKYS